MKFVRFYMTADNEEIDARHPVTLSTPIPSFSNFVCTFWSDLIHYGSGSTRSH